MKRSWIVAGLVMVVVAAGVFILTTKNTNDTKSGDKSATRSESQIISGGNSERSERFTSAETRQTEGMATKNTKGHEKSELSVKSVDRGEFVYSEEELSDPVLVLLGLDGKLHDYNSLLSAIAMLAKGNIAADDVAALRDMLTWPNDQFPEGMREIEINSIKNDVLDRLLRQKELPETMGYQLVDMFSDTESDPVWRDYCVQFMSPYYERAASELYLTTEGTEAQRGLASNTSVSSSEAGGPLRNWMLCGRRCLRRWMRGMKRLPGLP
ncbi:MAG: hypothetical protein JXR23_08830 [Pontiellaceae bacterium]|nr:hypothetical protein [Pontiellaceae bacterium]